MGYEEIRNKILKDIFSGLIMLISPATIIYILSGEPRNYEWIGIDGLFLIIGVVVLIICPVIYGIWYTNK